MKRTFWGAAFSGMVAMAALPLFNGCSTGNDNVASNDGKNDGMNDSISSITFDLQVGDDISLKTIAYKITNPNGYQKAGTVNVAQSATLTAVISGIPLGTGYTISMDGTAVGGKATCVGSASFDVAQPGTTPVSIHLQCTQGARTGSIMVNGSLNVCPIIDTLGASPAEVAVGWTIELTGLGVDGDLGPSPLTYAWTATSGTLADATAATTTFTCTAVGPATITLTVTDGDTCPAVQTVDVTCSAISTDPGLKVAFIGDTDQFEDYKAVLRVVKAEGAAGLLVNGDMTYSANPDAWWAATEEILGTNYPIFLARGNHDDSSWSGFLPKAANHMDGATRVAGAHDSNYKTTWRGLVIAAIHKGDTAANINPFLQDEAHLWKVCQWHQNQKAMQVGGKSDEMGWGVYEACREQGAIIQTGHEHSYERTKTLIDMTNQIVDPTCSSPTELCVGPGRTFVTVTGLGGNSVRPQLRCLPALAPYGCKGEWANIQTTNQGATTFGAQFITFNSGGPNKAKGYVKNVRGEVSDPFTITYGAFH